MSPIATRFGKYLLHERIGTGGMAEVWRATLPGTGGVRVRARTYSGAGGLGGLVAQYDADGEPLWTRAFDAGRPRIASR